MTIVKKRQTEEMMQPITEMMLRARARSLDCNVTSDLLLHDVSLQQPNKLRVVD